MKAEDLVSEAPQWEVYCRNNADSTPSSVGITVGDLCLMIRFSDRVNSWGFLLDHDGSMFYEKLLPNCTTIEEAIIEAQVAIDKYLASLSAALRSVPLIIS